MIPTEIHAEQAQPSVTENVDFTLHELNGYWHWYSSGPHFGDDYCSEDGFDLKEKTRSPTP